MRLRVQHSAIFLAALALAVLVFSQQPMQAEDAISFERDVRPILKAYCFDCHGGGEKPEGNLDLRRARFALRGGDSGPGIVPKEAEKSLLVSRMKSGEMPPTEKKVPPEKIAVVAAWIAAGAPTLRPEPEQLPPGTDITPEERGYWFYQPLRRPEPPQLANTVTGNEPAELPPTIDRLRTEIDAFLLARLREKGLRFSAEADRLTLIRRVAFDLTGLPPSSAEIQEFQNDPAADAYEKMVDRYLQSPRYGERWGRHWLDVAGYADSEGNGNDDTPRPYAYKYRDYVIRAFNADKSFDQFIIEQLAGDELALPPWNNLTADQIEKLAASGFLKLGVDGTASGGADEALAANQTVADALKIVGSSLLGLSIGCAQCHDHKYDPIPQADYFRLRAIFEPAIDPSHWRRPVQRLVSLYTDADRAKAAAVDAEAQTLQTEFNAKQSKFVAEALEKELLKHPEELRTALRDAYNTPGDKRTEEQKKLLADRPSVNISPGVLYQYNQAAADELKKDQEKINAKRAEKPVEDFVSATAEVAGVVPTTHLHYRGDYRQPKQPVTPGDLTIAAPDGSRFEIAEKDPSLATSGRRLAWGRHLMSGRHPLVGRVLVNRLWMEHFGRGIVETAGEFGILGTRPTHPELLDWLADEFARQKWSLKQMHRLILKSTAYRQTSTAPALMGIVNPRDVDHDNLLYWRFPLRRLEAEAIRDRMLSASGRLDLTPFGPAIPVEEDFAGQVVVKEDKPRRSVYLQVRRTKPMSFLTTFDAPVMMVNCERRSSSTGAIQSLMLMNNEQVLKEAGLFAQRLRKETPTDYLTDLAAPHLAKFPKHNAVWQFGYGTFDEAAKKVAEFHPLPHFTGSAWQGGAQLPDAAIGWVILHATGGHPGNGPARTAIRRWTAPRDGILALAGKLKHLSENGDGVRGRVVSSRAGVVGEWQAKAGEVETNVPRVEIVAGETIDLVVDCLANETSDSFEWPVDVKLVDGGGAVVDQWNSAADFHGPAGASLPQQVAYAWQIAYQRTITPAELDAACRFLEQQIAYLRKSGDKEDPEVVSLTSLCQ